MASTTTVIQTDPFTFLGTFSPNYKTQGGWNNFIWFIAIPVGLLAGWSAFKKYSWMGIAGVVMVAIAIPFIISFLKNKQEEAVKANINQQVVNPV